MSQIKIKKCSLLLDSQRQWVLDYGFEIGECYKTHSSTFYPLNRDNQKYLLKIDQTKSGSLIHQHLYSKYQENLKLPHIECVCLSGDGTILIMKKIENAAMLKNTATIELMKLRGEQMRQIHDLRLTGFKIWVEEHGEFMGVSKNDAIEEFLVMAEDRLYKLSLENEFKVSKITEFIRINIDKLDNSISFLHGDPHQDNVMVRENNPIIIDPSGLILQGSRYNDLAIVAFDYPGYFDSGLENASTDFDFLSSFFEGYGQIDIEQLYYFMCLRGTERFAFSNIIPKIDLLTKSIFSKLT